MVNALLITWAWLGFNQGKGLGFFTVDEVGLMLTIPLLILTNLLWCTITLCLKKADWAKGFGVLFLLSFFVTIIVWIHGGINGVTS